jgi:tagaturonate reductase
METLNRSLLTNGFKFNEDLTIGNTKPLPEKAVQFGEGNFLRAFVDMMFDKLNEAGKFNGGITLFTPIAFGPITKFINDQEGLYTLLARGMENGVETCDKRLITSVNRCINPYEQFDEYCKCAKNPELRFVISNTTEAGISYAKEDRVTDKPQEKFPAKVTNFLYTRYQEFNGAADKGLVFLACELIDDNGQFLKKYVLQYAEDWGLEQGFIDWVNNTCLFCSTLVDRIVTGYPRANAAELCEEFGYTDNIIVTSEIFHTWVIEGPQELAKELPFAEIGLKVIYTDDVHPYKKRKVRILNGAHTCSVLAAYLDGKDLVGELMADPLFYRYLEKALNTEIIPTIEGDELTYDSLKSFADAVFDRFKNPFIKHKLLDISLNSTAKFRARVLATITEAYKETGKLLPILTYSFAALLAFYRGTEIRVDEKSNSVSLIGHRGDDEYLIRDDKEVLEYFSSLWTKTDATSKDSVAALVKDVCANETMWGEDLNKLGDFAAVVTDHLYGILTDGAAAEIKKCFNLI